MWAGVLVRSVTHARAIDLGFSADRTLFATVDVSTLSYPRERGVDFFEQVRARLGQDSRVSSASFVGTLPLTVSSQALGFVKDGAASPEPNQRVPPVFFDSVSPGYFRTVGIPLLAGRDFGPGDLVGARQVAIVNETLASRFWPGENPLGQQLRSLGVRNSLGPPIEVVGLARNAKYATVGEDAKMFIYLPFAQQYTSRVTLLVKTRDDPSAAIPLVRAAVKDLDPDVAVFRVGTLDQATRVSLLPVQAAATLAVVLGLIALALAAIGIYAMTTYLVRQRTREVGIRLALGARPSELVRALTREGLRWTIAGLVLGLAASLGATQLLRSLLYEVSSTDPVAFIVIPAFLFLAAYVACRAPASAASRVDPLRALREE
jgi:predicted permease